MFDSHCHLAFHSDFEPTELWDRARAAGVLEAIDVGIDLKTSLAAQARNPELDGVRWTAGLHPTDAAAFAEEWSELERLCRLADCAAIGETGMDLYWDKATPAQQEESFEAHLQLARELGKPVIVHCRDAFDETYAVLQRHVGITGVMHCFSGGVAEARTALDLGMHVSFAGPVTYKKNDDLREAARFVPEDRILVETDAPFLPPQSKRGKRNEPAWIVETTARIAKERGSDLESFTAITAANTRALFGGGGATQT